MRIQSMMLTTLDAEVEITLRPDNDVIEISMSGGRQYMLDPDDGFALFQSIAAEICEESDAANREAILAAMIAMRCSTGRPLNRTERRD